MATPTKPQPRSNTQALAHREQMVTSQAPPAKSRTPLYDLSNLYGVIGGSLSNRRPSISVMHEMRTDAILHFAALAALVPIFTAKWRIRCKDAQLAAFVEQALKRVLGRTILSFALARDFGFQALVKEFGLLQPDWEYIDRNAEDGAELKPVWDHDFKCLVWEPPVTLRPEAVAPLWNDSDGSFNGIQLNSSGYPLGNLSFPTLPFYDVDGNKDPSKLKVDLEHSLWVVNQRDGTFGSVWGYPHLGYALDYWRAYKLTLTILSRSVERKGDPVVVVRYPEGESSEGGTMVSNRTIAERIGRQAKSGSLLLIPSDGHDEQEGGAKNPKWAVEYLKGEEKFEELQKILGYLDTMKFRSQTVSELALAEGSGGTSSRNVAGETAVRTAEAQFMTQVEYDSIINRYMIPQIIEENFPEKRDVPCMKETLSFGEDEVNLAKDILTSRANSDAAGLPIDWPRMLERFNIDSLEGDALADFERRLLAAPAQQPSVPTGPPEAGGDAGVTDTGFYYDAPGLIELGEEDAVLLHSTIAPFDHALLAELPKTKHFSDSEVLGQTRLIRKLWGDLLKAQYDDFVSFMDSDPDLSDDVALADEDERAEKAADQLVKAWKFSGKQTRAVVRRTGLALKAIFARAGELELKRSGMKLDDWKPEEKDLAKWVQDNAAGMVKSVEETTRQQLRSFLVDQVKADANAQKIAAAAREHFSEFSGWRATRLARTEVRKFYNAATLFAAQAAGAKQVQALDGRYGNSDPDCVARNGKIFPIEAAFKEDQEEHPNGTLAWRIINRKTELSVARVPVGEDAEYAAWFDRETDTIYMVDGLSPAQEAHYLIQVGDWLESIT